MESLRSCGLNNLVEFRHPCVLIRLQTIPTASDIELATHLIVFTQVNRSNRRTKSGK